MLACVFFAFLTIEMANTRVASLTGMLLGGEIILKRKQVGDAPWALIYTYISFEQLLGLIFQLATKLHSVLNNCSVYSTDHSCKFLFFVLSLALCAGN